MGWEKRQGGKNLEMLPAAFKTCTVQKKNAWKPPIWVKKLWIISHVLKCLKMISLSTISVRDWKSLVGGTWCREDKSFADTPTPHQLLQSWWSAPPPSVQSSPSAAGNLEKQMQNINLCQVLKLNQLTAVSKLKQAKLYIPKIERKEFTTGCIENIKLVSQWKDECNSL